MFKTTNLDNVLYGGLTGDAPVEVRFLVDQEHDILNYFLTSWPWLRHYQNLSIILKASKSFSAFSSFEFNIATHHISG